MSWCFRIYSELLPWLSIHILTAVQILHRVFVTFPKWSTITITKTKTWKKVLRTIDSPVPDGLGIVQGVARCLHHTELFYDKCYLHFSAKFIYHFERKHSDKRSWSLSLSLKISSPADHTLPIHQSSTCNCTDGEIVILLMNNDISKNYPTRVRSVRARRACALAQGLLLYSRNGEDFLMGQLNFFTETAVTPERKVKKSFPRWEINRHVEG